MLNMALGMMPASGSFSQDTSWPSTRPPSIVKVLPVPVCPYLVKQIKWFMENEKAMTDGLLRGMKTPQEEFFLYTGTIIFSNILSFHSNNL